MKQTFKKPSYYLLSQAMDGDEKAIEKILAFYDPYISKCNAVSWPKAAGWAKFQRKYFLLRI